MYRSDVKEQKIYGQNIWAFMVILCHLWMVYKNKNKDDDDGNDDN